jgi:hypothetical protein
VSPPPTQQQVAAAPAPAPEKPPPPPNKKRSRGAGAGHGATAKKARDTAAAAVTAGVRPVVRPCSKRPAVATQKANSKRSKPDAKKPSAKKPSAKPTGKGGDKKMAALRQLVVSCGGKASLLKGWYASRSRFTYDLGEVYYVVLTTAGTFRIGTRSLRCARAAAPPAPRTPTTSSRRGLGCARGRRFFVPSECTRLNYRARRALVRDADAIGVA